MLLLDELVSSIGCERDGSSSESLEKFPWLSDSEYSCGANDDSSLASSILRGELLVDANVVESIIRLRLEDSADAAMNSLQITETLALKLVSHFDDLVHTFILLDNYSAEPLRRCIRSDVSDEVLGKILAKCAVFLEESQPNMSHYEEEISKYLKFVSLVIDSKFLSWHVNSGSVGASLARLSAAVDQYRRVIVAGQLGKMKSEGSQIASLLKKKTDPQSNGKIFYCDLK